MSTPSPSARKRGDPPPPELGPPPSALTRGSRIAAALENVYAGLRKGCPDLPEEVVFVTGAGRSGRGADTLGHFRREAWREATEDGSRPHEIFVAGEVFARGPEEVLHTIAHEAAHALAVVRKVDDGGGRYHNQRYVAFAAELGLACPLTPDHTRGYAATKITPEAKVTHEDAIADLGDAIDVYLVEPPPPAGTGGGGGRGRGRNLLKAVCACFPSKVIRAAPATLLRGQGIGCLDCGERFYEEAVVVEDDDADFEKLTKAGIVLIEEEDTDDG
jgi:hypothetical protein